MTQKEELMAEIERQREDAASGQQYCTPEPFDGGWLFPEDVLIEQCIEALQMSYRYVVMHRNMYVYVDHG